MKNILSYQPRTKFTGKEITEWINYQISHQTSHFKQALYMTRYRLVNHREYIIHTHSWSYDVKPYRYPQVVRADFHQCHSLA